MGLYDYRIYSIIKCNARSSNNRIALISGNQRISHGRLLEKVDGLACALSSAGLEKGDRIGILGQNSLEFVYLYGAATKIEAIVPPINWRLDSEEIEYNISDGAPKVLFVGPDFQKIVTSLVSKFNFTENTYALGQAGGLFEIINALIDSMAICPEVKAQRS